MHNIEPFYNWLLYYDCKEDPLSPFYRSVSDEFFFSNKIYNYFIHPQWDSIGSETLYLKVLFVDYNKQFCVIEMIGEWNDAINNDIEILKRNLIDVMIANGVKNFIVICENVMNFHHDLSDYYQEWHDDIAEKNGWISFLNINNWVYDEMKTIALSDFIFFLDISNWRNFSPKALEKSIYHRVKKHLLL